MRRDARLIDRRASAFRTLIRRMRAIRNLDVGAFFARVASFSARRATLVVARGRGPVLVAGAALALTLDPGRTASAAGDGGGKSAAATKDLRSKFGGDPVVVLVRGRLTGMLLTEDVARMLSLEGCISGNVPRGAKPAAPVCSEFAKRKPVQVVYGPGTFINEAANQVLDRIKFDRGARGGRGRPCRARGAPRRAPPGPVQGRAGAVRAGGAPHRHRQLRAACAGAGGALRAQQRAGAQQPGVRAAARVRAEPRCGGPEAALRVSVPAQRRRGDPGAAAPGPQRRRAQPGGGDDPRSRGGEALRPEVRQLRRVRSAGRRRGRRDGALGCRAGARARGPPAGRARAGCSRRGAVPCCCRSALGAGATAITLGGAALVGGSFSAGVAAAMPRAVRAGGRHGRFSS